MLFDKMQLKYLRGQKNVSFLLNVNARQSEPPDSTPGWVDVSVSTQLFGTTVSKLNLKHGQGLMSLLIRGGRPDTPSPPLSGMWIFPPWSPAIGSWSCTSTLCGEWGERAKPISGRLGGGVTVLSAFITVKVILNFKCSCYCTHINKETTNRPGSPPSAAKNNPLTGTLPASLTRLNEQTQVYGNSNAQIISICTMIID